MSQMNLPLGESLKKDGMKNAADANHEVLMLAREIALHLAKQTGGRCHADMVQSVLIANGLELGNAAGSLFKTQDWEWTGDFVKSDRVSNHARIIRVWRLK